MSIHDPNLNRPQIYPARLVDISPVPCPNCGQKVQGFASCKVESDSSSIGGHQAACSDKLPPSVLQSRMTWSLYPCYCKVDQFWASNFAEEMGRRDSGQVPQGVTGLSKTERSARRKEIEQRITALYRKRDAAVAAGMSSRVKALERDIVTMTQQLCVLIPGAHNTLPPLNLSKDVAVWAASHNLHVPPGNNRNLAEGHAASITINDIRLMLAVDPDYQSMPAGMIASTAKEIYDQLAAYVAHGTSMHAKSIAAIAKLIPNADKFLPSRGVDAAEDPDPRISFARNLAKRPVRKMVRLKRKPRLDDTDD